MDREVQKCVMEADFEREVLQLQSKNLNEHSMCSKLQREFRLDQIRLCDKLKADLEKQSQAAESILISAQSMIHRTISTAVRDVQLLGSQGFTGSTKANEQSRVEKREVLLFEDANEEVKEQLFVLEKLAQKKEKKKQENSQKQSKS